MCLNAQSKQAHVCALHACPCLTQFAMVQRYQVPIYGQPGVVTQHAGSVGAGYPIAQPVNRPQYA